MLKPSLDVLPTLSLRAAPPLTPDTPTPLLAGLTPTQFMRRYWQKKPLLIRQAIPGITPPVSRDALFALAVSGDSEARLITHFRNQWQLNAGPLDASDLPSIKRREWTLLVQGVNLYDDSARALLERFRFIPDARLDDLMMSYATDGGGVGPHFDSYDVFLLQVHGARRWRISAQKELTLKTELPLKILQHFEPDEEWVLEAGDMLYLPPHIAHDGVAIGECMTCSIGFRAPSAHELIGQFLDYLAERNDATATTRQRNTYYRDPRQPAVACAAELPPTLIEHIGALLARIKWDSRDIASFAGRYCSEPKAHVVFDPPKPTLSEAAFMKRVTRTGIRLDRKTLLLYGPRSYFMNGEENYFAPHRKGLRKELIELANRRCLDAKCVVTLLQDAIMTSRLYEWYCAGWIQVGETS